MEVFLAKLFSARKIFMYLKDITKTVHRDFAPDKVFNFRVMFPDLDTGYYNYSGAGIYGPGYDPCPYKSWFPAISVDVPVGWFVNISSFDYYSIQVPVPDKVAFQRIKLTFAADRYKKLENWFERWYETIVNGGKHMGTLREISRPLRVVKTFSNPYQGLTRDDPTKGFNFTTFWVVPDGEIIDQLIYESRTKSYTVGFNIVGKKADTRAMLRPKTQF